jgi:hypothetical protein
VSVLRELGSISTLYRKDARFVNISTNGQVSWACQLFWSVSLVFLKLGAMELSLNVGLTSRVPAECGEVHVVAVVGWRRGRRRYEGPCRVLWLYKISPLKLTIAAVIRQKGTLPIHRRCGCITDLSCLIPYGVGATGIITEYEPRDFVVAGDNRQQD